MIIQALRALGKNNIDTHVITALSAKLTPKEKQTMLNESRYITAWIYEKIKTICGGSEP